MLGWCFTVTLIVSGLSTHWLVGGLEREGQRKGGLAGQEDIDACFEHCKKEHRLDGYSYLGGSYFMAKQELCPLYKKFLGCMTNECQDKHKGDIAFQMESSITQIFYNFHEECVNYDESEACVYRCFQQSPFGTSWKWIRMGKTYTDADFKSMELDFIENMEYDVCSEYPKLIKCTKTCAGYETHLADLKKKAWPWFINYLDACPNGAIGAKVGGDSYVLIMWGTWTIMIQSLVIKCL